MGIADINLSVMIKLHEFGFGQKEAFYNVTDEKLEMLFKQVEASLFEDYEKLSRACDNNPFMVEKMVSHPHELFSPAHRDQIRNLAKLINQELKE